MQFRVLGPVEADVNGSGINLGGLKQRTVLALLIARAGNVVTTETLIDAVYGDDAPSGARRSIQTYVSNLRGLVGSVLSSDGAGYRLDVDRNSIDAAQFEDAVTSASSIDEPQQIADELRAALALWRGGAYSDVDALNTLPAEITRLEELRVVATERRVDAELASGRHASLIAELESLTVEYPLREHFRAQHMVALYRSGRQADALRAFEKTRTYLLENSGLDPSPELRRLEQQILEQDPGLTLEAAPSIRRAAVLVVDVPDVAALSTLAPADRDALIDLQGREITQAVADHAGEVLAERGTAIYAVFPTVEAAASAAADGQAVLAAQNAPMRMAISSGDVEVRSGGEVTGPPINRAAILIGAGHAGQILLASDAHQEMLDSGAAGWITRSLGSHQLAGLSDPVAVHQLVLSGSPDAFPPLRVLGMSPPLPTATHGLPGYELREQVGSGVFGVVHRAYQPSVGREVAVKVIRPEFANHPVFIRRFEVEAQLVARLEHPHIVPLHDYWRDPDGAYLVLRWLSGGSLEDRLESGPVDIATMNRILGDIASALDHAHRHGVAHRDLKPSNVLFDGEDNAFLSDFGIAKELRDGDADAIADDVVGLGALIERCLGSSSVDPSLRSVFETAHAGGYPSVADLLEAWETATGEANEATAAAVFTPTRNPYKGLRAFREGDAGDFHGREAEVTELLRTVESNALVAVVGPSGIGKSSVVRAGLIPALRGGAIPGSEQWLVTDLMPGPYPFEELASAVLRVASSPTQKLEDELRRDERGLIRAVRRYLPEDATLLLVVDQFEELFTLVRDDGERAAFLELLRASVEDHRARIRVVLTVRADFFDRPLRDGAFGALIQKATVPIAAPTDEALRAIAENPASAVGIVFEPGLVDRIVADVRNQAGALPLLEFTLTGLFESRESDVLRANSYTEMGGVRGALAQHAEAVFDRLDNGQRSVVQEVFLRLVNVTEGRPDTRRRVRLGELQRLGIDRRTLTSVLDAFGEERLLAFDRDAVTRGPTVELAHEALLSEWPRFVSWIDDHREHLVLRGRLQDELTEWEGADRSSDYLLSGGRLAQHEAWVDESDLALSAAETEYLGASRSAEAERAAAVARTRRNVLVGFGVAAVVGLFLAVVAFLASREATEQRDLAVEAQEIAEEERDIAEMERVAADDERDRAETAQRIAEEAQNAATAAKERAVAQSLLAASRAVTLEDPELSVLLAISGASRLGGDAQALAVLRDAMSSFRAISAYELDGAPVSQTTGDLSPDGSMVVIGRSPGASVVAIDAVNGEERWTYAVPVPDPAVTTASAKFTNGGLEVVVQVGASVSPGAEVRQSSAMGTYVLDAQTGTLLRRFAAHPCGGTMAPLDASDGYALLEVPSASTLVPETCNSPQGVALLVDAVRLDLTTGETAMVEEGLDPSAFATVALGPQGRLAVVDKPLDGDATIKLIDVDIGEIIRVFDMDGI
ncbi:MAG: BTAD domain-containing putative transcriptional regulator, partial [Acidimicrobiia bacterium]|nr:BTAD domain-containing putative transcriptional regulator [Acidimicrobiia bacterium]